MKQLWNWSEVIAVLRNAQAKRVYLPGNGNLIPPLEAAIQEHAAELSGMQCWQLLSLGTGWDRDDVYPHVRIVTPFIGPTIRDLVNAGRADFIPMHLSLVSKLFEKEWIPDVVFLHTSLPDRSGRVTPGLDAGLSIGPFRQAKAQGKIVIAVMNARMPHFSISPLMCERMEAGCPIHTHEIDYAIEIDEPLHEHSMGEIDEISFQIGKQIARRIENGSTIQLGIGGIPNAVLAALTEHEDLGVHSEMLSDGLVQLLDSGVVTGRQKTLLRSMVVVGFVLGTRALYDIVEDERFAFLPQSWINDPRVIARNQRMVSVNSALAVSLEGDVCASSIGTMKYSGVGGARDFALGADMSDGGWPVIALPSTYLSGGELKSRICAVLPRGAHVTSSGDTVQNVVTEFGSASLKGRTIRQRAAAMIRLAHPDFQDGLLEEARALHGLQALSLAEGECAFIPAV